MTVCRPAAAKDDTAGDGGGPDGLERRMLTSLETRRHTLSPSNVCNTSPDCWLCCDAADPATFEEHRKETVLC